MKQALRKLLSRARLFVHREGKPSSPHTYFGISFSFPWRDKSNNKPKP